MSKFLDTIEELAGKVMTALEGPVLPAVIDIGKSVLDLAESAKEVITTDDLPKLQATIDELEPKVTAHADATEKELRGS